MKQRDSEMTNERQARREELHGLLGDLPQGTGDVVAHKVSEEQRGTYVLEKLVLDLNGVELVPAYFTRPTCASGPVPAILYNHAHGGDYKLGKDELLDGRSALQDPPYAEALAAAGFAALCIDHWSVLLHVRILHARPARTTRRAARRPARSLRRGGRA